MSSGWVVWIAGRPASGKTTLGRAVRRGLSRKGRVAVLLDSDEVRAALTPPPGYGPKARDNFYATLGKLAALLARQGLVVLVAATANLRSYRERARGAAPRFLEVYVDVPAEVCARRDPKGLYALARQGRAPHLPSAGAAFEAPLRPDVVAHGGRDRRAAAAIERALRLPAGQPARRASTSPSPSAPAPGGA